MTVLLLQDGLIEQRCACGSTVRFGATSMRPRYPPAATSALGAGLEDGRRLVEALARRGPRPGMPERVRVVGIGELGLVEPLDRGVRVDRGGVAQEDGISPASSPRGQDRRGDGLRSTGGPGPSLPRRAGPAGACGSRRRAARRVRASTTSTGLDAVVGRLQRGAEAVLLARNDQAGPSRTPGRRKRPSSAVRRLGRHRPVARLADDGTGDGPALAVDDPAFDGPDAAEHQDGRLVGARRRPATADERAASRPGAVASA